MGRRRFRTLGMLAMLGAWTMARAADPPADYAGTVKPLLKGRGAAANKTRRRTTSPASTNSKQPAKKAATRKTGKKTASRPMSPATGKRV